MRALTTAELLNVWENGLRLSLLNKTLHLLDTACSDGFPPDPGLLSIGERDASLLQLREWMFGSTLLNITDCPACRERIEWTNLVSDLRLPSGAVPASAPYSLTAGTYQVQYRLPNSYDIAGHHAVTDPQQILAACILQARHHDQACSVDQLPPEVMEAVDEDMAATDAQADIQMAVSCPFCAHEWQAQFDIMSYLWAEIDNWAKRTLGEVARLAAAFGWSEPQILNLSSQRRQFYLDIILK